MSSSSGALSRDLLAGAAPWAPYWLGVSLGYPASGAVVAVFLLLVVRFPAWREFKLFDLAVLIFLLSIALDHMGLNLYTVPSLRRAALPLLLAAAAFGSLVVRYPCTMQYAREMVAPHWWENRHFVRVNQVLTAVWGCTFLVMTALAWFSPAGGRGHLIAGTANLLLFAVAAWFTHRYPRWYRMHRYVPLVRAGKEPFLRSPRR